MFQSLPNVMTADEMIDKAFKKASKVTVPRKRKRKLAKKEKEMQKIKKASQILKDNLSYIIDSYPNIDEVPIFYLELLDALVDKNKLKKSLGALNWAKKTIESIERQSIREIRDKDPSTVKRSAFGRYSSVMRRISEEIDFLIESTRKLRKIPQIDLTIPTVVVAGPPNVGKSTLIRSISTARPEIKTYPFTTKGIMVGLIKKDGERIQIIDTPGLLDRSMEKRNKIEIQAIIALKHLADLIVFMIDPTETCGYTLEEQLNLLEEITSKFDLKILKIANKCDIFDEKINGFLPISARDGTNIEYLVKKILQSI
ncbi:MAG: NOG1 family protein [Candidatus Hydrothermarchaeota archaeon]